MSTEDDDLYQCVGICMVDEDSGLCMGCGRPVQQPAGQASTPDSSTSDKSPSGTPASS